MTSLYTKNPEYIIAHLKKLNEYQPFTLLNNQDQEIGRGIFFKGIYRMRFGEFLNGNTKAYIDYQQNQVKKLIDDFDAKSIRTIKHFFSPDVNKAFLHLLMYASNTNLSSLRQLLENYEDYYALTQTTTKEILNHKVEYIGPATANKIASIMAIVRGNF